MNVSSGQLFSKARPESVTGKILQFPLARIFVVALFILPYLLIHNNILADFVASSSGVLHIVFVIADAAVSLFALFFLYRLYAKWIEKRDAVEISRSRSLTELGSGFLVSFGLVGFMVLFMVLLGYYRIDQASSPEILIDAFVFFGVGAFIQVLAFRLVLFRLTEELLGSWLAFALIAVIFGIVHLRNPEAGVWSLVSLVLGDVLLFAAFICTRRIWLVWGLHWGWNFFQDGVFGMPNSGVTEFVSWIQPIIQGPVWITGGRFGIETSFIAFFISLVVGLVILKMAVDKKQIVKPIWSRIK
ncbi:MAG: CPBP family intramembrane metalloprotease [Candidatus Aminicenantes bacterium]|nr:MAG: CPBP family intramembrane metalloprotease [Candidatus Aminicenantes bacterium]